MTHPQTSRGLDQVYGATDENELSAAYSVWANDYDRETAELGYTLPFMVTAWLTRYQPDTAAPVLDAGCGTGLSAPYLAALGYADVHGFDLSGDMLKLAAARGGYRELKQARLGAELPYEDGRFAAYISSGVFTAGHAPASSMDELARILKPGGHGIMTVRDFLIEEKGFGQKFKELEDRGIWRLAEKSPPYRAFAVAEPETFVHTYVFRKL